MVSFLGTGYAISLPSRLKCPEAKMKLPPDVSFHTEQRLMVWRPRGVLDEKMVNQITTFIGSQEATSKIPFDRFTDTTLLDAIDLSFDYVFHVALYRRMRTGRRGAEVPDEYIDLKKGDRVFDHIEEELAFMRGADFRR